MMQSNARKQGGFDLDIKEWNVPEEVLAVLLKDRSTGRPWGTTPLMPPAPDRLAHYHRIYINAVV